MVLLVMALAGCGTGPATTQSAGGNKVTIEVFHADSLAGPLAQLKKAFEAKNPDITVHLTAGKSKDLADRIYKGELCDLFAPSDPAVAKGMFGNKIAGSDTNAANWYVTFSANEMVVITKKGNPLAIKQMADLSKAGVKLVRVTGATDLATKRTLDFIKKATAAEGKPDLGQQLIAGTAVEAGSIPEAVQALKDGKGDAGIVYLSAAVAAADSLDIVTFPAGVNLSDAIRNVATVPASAKNPAAALRFLKFILSADGREILKQTGQPPVVPPIPEGPVPANLL